MLVMEGLDPTLLIDLATKQMPYGKYKGWVLKSLPEPYLVWMNQQNTFPKGRLGMLLATLYEIKLNGLVYLIRDAENLES